MKKYHTSSEIKTGLLIMWAIGFMTSQGVNIIKKAIVEAAPIDISLVISIIILVLLVVVAWNISKTLGFSIDKYIPKNHPSTIKDDDIKNKELT